MKDNSRLTQPGGLEAWGSVSTKLAAQIWSADGSHLRQSKLVVRNKAKPLWLASKLVVRIKAKAKLSSAGQLEDVSPLARTMFELCLAFCVVTPQS